jgi:hypothetical protein
MASDAPVDHNGSMTGNAFIRWLLLAAHILVCAVMFTLSDREGPPNDYVIAVFLGLAGSQLCLAACWLVLHIMPWWRRGTLLAAALVFWVVNNGRYSGEYETWIAFLGPLAVAFILTSVLMRFGPGARWITPQELATQEELTPDRQFSIRTMMLLTAVVAVGCTLLEFVLRPWLKFGTEMLPYWGASYLSGVGLIVAAFGADGHGIRRFLIWLALSIAATYLRTLSKSGLSFDAAYLMSATECSAIALTCAALRVSGMWLLTGQQQRAWRRRHQASLESVNTSIEPN